MDRWVSISHDTDQKYQEAKIITTDVDNFNIVGPTPVGYLMNGLVRGYGDGQRTGRTIRMKRFRVSGVIQPRRASGNYDQGNIVVIAIVYDRQPNGALASWSGSTGIMVNGTAYDQAANVPERYLILEHKICVQQPYIYSALNTFGEAGGDILIPFFLEAEVDLPTIFNSTNGGTIADIVTGSVAFYIGTLVSNESTVAYETSVDYYDDN